MTLTERLDALEAVARAATQGLWIQQGDTVAMNKHANSAVILGMASDGALSKNAAHIAAFSPPTALALIQALKAIQRAVDEQAEDEGLWFVPAEGTQFITEAYLQQELRSLHRVIETALGRLCE